MSVSATLVLAWGNPGRRDDGLGPAFAASIDALGLPRVEVESAYQLQVEDAVKLAACGRVLFVDADRCCDEPFRVQRVEPAAGGLGFTSHGLSPARLLALGRALFGAEPQAWLMGIRGYDFDQFGEGLSSARGSTSLAPSPSPATPSAKAEGSAARFPACHPEQATRGQP